MGPAIGMLLLLAALAPRWVLPEIRMSSLKSSVTDCGPLSEMIRGRAAGYDFSARSTMHLTSWSFIDGRGSSG